MVEFKPQIPAKREFLGGDLLAQALRHLGVEVAFGVHGGHLDAFLVGAEECGIKLVDTRHETTAVQAAEGYAKVSGKVGVCFVTANSGFANGLAGLATAYADRSPIFVVTSSPPLQDAETNALQGFHDQVVVSKPLTKFSHRVTNVEEIPRIVAYGMRSANSGIKGPVLIDFPIDVLFTPPQMHRIAFGAITAPPAYNAAPDPAAVDNVIGQWNKAKRPVIITGTGARGTDAALVKLAEATHSPVFYSNKFSSPIPANHELRGGMATRLAAFAGGPQPDFVLLLGARTGFLLGGRGGAIIPNKDCVLAQVDLDGSEIGKSHAVEIGIVSDVGLFAEALLEKKSKISVKRNDEWIRDCRDHKSTLSNYIKGGEVMPDGLLHPYLAMNAFMRALPKDSIIMIDGGEAGQWAAMTVEAAEPKVAIVSTGYLGHLGNGWGYSLGAAVADPSRLVVNVHGDGSAGFHIQELDTFARFGLNILTLVANNYVWGMSLNGQELIYQGKSQARPAIRLSKSCKYEVVAQGFNNDGAFVDKFEDIKPTTERMSRSGKPGLINMIVSPQPTTPATLSMVGMTEDKNVIVVPYYDNVPRPYYKDGAATADGSK
ncbi:acetolactate synthase I/II/III large subunit [Neohortaea acidophila]|uniref:Acetolactate synthase I/II/III large subunit n=1 Tax=Neohortaea acidophila TaxID=245834 RepID=A0A6A6PZ27_9PEZI|nr:acetolactate synthase I/II/III large subunit [Neohortaea acidophila]KAF2485390.1 acetolactate synthase I/II/III large subunit [Neohortaea acidophila]